MTKHDWSAKAVLFMLRHIVAKVCSLRGYDLCTWAVHVHRDQGQGDRAVHRDIMAGKAVQDALCEVLRPARFIPSICSLL